MKRAGGPRQLERPPAEFVLARGYRDCVDVERTVANKIGRSMDDEARRELRA
jgi:hypothetical protein